MGKKEELEFMKKLSDNDKILASIHKCYAYEKEKEGWDILKANLYLSATKQHCSNLLKNCDLVPGFSTIWYDNRSIYIRLCERKTNEFKTLILYYSPNVNPNDVYLDQHEIACWAFRDLVSNKSELPPVYGKPNWNAKKEIIDCIDRGFKGGYLEVIALEEKTLWHAIILETIQRFIEEQRKENR